MNHQAPDADAPDSNPADLPDPHETPSPGPAQPSGPADDEAGQEAPGNTTDNASEEAAGGAKAETQDEMEDGTGPQAPSALEEAIADGGLLGGEIGGEAGPENLAPMKSEADYQAEIAQLKDQLLRVVAEMENLRRRSARELEDRVKYAPGELARDLLPVADNLDRALSSLDAEARAADERLEQFAAGIEAIGRDLLAAFEKNGIRRIEPMEQPFNPAEHEAMMKIKDETRPPGVVVQVMQAGYMLRDRLLRPAMVGVAEGGPPPGEVDETA